MSQTFTYLVGGRYHGKRVPLSSPPDPSYIHYSALDVVFNSDKKPVPVDHYRLVEVALFTGTKPNREMVKVPYYIVYEPSYELLDLPAIYGFWAGVVMTHVAGNLSSLCVSKNLAALPLPLTQDETDAVLTHLEWLRSHSD